MPMQLQDGRQLWHTPLPDLPAAAQQGLVDFWNGAKKSLFIVDYSFNMPAVVTAIAGLLARGVQVTCVLDHSQSKGGSETPIIAELQALRSKYPYLFTLVIGTSSLHQIIHDKFSVRDGVDAQYGSFNYTVAAGKEDNFYFIELNSVVATDLLGIGEGIKTWIEQHEPQYNIS